MTLSELVATIDTERRHGNLSSAIRLFVLDHYRAHDEGHSIGARHAVGGRSASLLRPD